MQFEELRNVMLNGSSRPSRRWLSGVEQTAAVVAGLSAAERRSLAPEVATLARTHSSWWRDDSPRPKEPLEATVIAVAGTLVASKLPGALRRLSDESPSERTAQASQGLLPWIIRVLRARGLEADPRLGAELARRVRTNDRSSSDWYFDLAREILRRSSGEPPVHPGFALVWLGRRQFRADIRARPGWSVLILGALANRGTGQLLDELELQGALVQLTAEGLVPRADLLDAVIGALQTTDRKVDLHGLVALHEQLDPSDDEVHARVGQYVRLTAAAPAFVATLAQRRLRVLDEVGRLPASVAAEITAAILVRPDKGLFRAQLTWLREILKRTAPQGREALVVAASAGLGHPDPALQKRVLDLLVPYGKTLSGGARQELAVAAGALAPDLRPLAAQFIGSDAPADPSSFPELSAPPPPQPIEPISEPELLAEELAVFYQGYDSDRQVSFQAAERCLDALVRFSWEDPEQLHTALAPLMARLSWLPEGPPRRTSRRGRAGVGPGAGHADHAGAGDDHAGDAGDAGAGDVYAAEVSYVLDALGLSIQAARACAGRPVQQRRQQELAPEALPQLNYRWHEVSVGAVLLRRFAEIGAGIWWAPVPVLLATPTTAEGALDADELLRRLHLVEAAGCRPWPNDLDQAYLRVRPADRERVLKVVHRVAGEQSAARLSALGAAQATVSLEPWTRQIRDVNYYHEEDEFRTELIAVLEPFHSFALPEPWDRLWRLPAPGGRAIAHDTAWLSCWPAILPFDRDVIAAHLHRELDGLGRRRADVIRAHAEVPGPIGSASLLLYCEALSSPGAEDRVSAAEALTILVGRNELDSTSLGYLLGRLAVDRRVKLNRIVEALREVGRAGAWPAVWKILAAALPRCLSATHGPALTGLADLVALAVEAAQSAQAKGPVKGLADVAARKGSSRLRSEARRLSGVLAG